MRRPVGKLRRTWYLAAHVALVAGTGCGEEPVPPIPSQAEDQLTAWGVGRLALLVAAGDLASDNDGDSFVAALLGRLTFDAFLTLGDNAYLDGSIESFRTYWQPVFGPFDRRVRPTLGNHDYETPNAAGYMEYFNTRAPFFPQNAEYYSFDVGGWRWFALNSQIAADSLSPQYLWLKGQLDQNPPGCIGAYWHRPPFNAGAWGNTVGMEAIWSLLASRGAALLLAGHDHNYQRWRAVDGITSFVVGTGGGYLFPIARQDSGLVVSEDRYYGVLQLALWEAGAEFRFVTTEGAVIDEGAVECRPIAPSRVTESPPR